MQVLCLVITIMQDRMWLCLSLMNIFICRRQMMNVRRLFQLRLFEILLCLSCARKEISLPSFMVSHIWSKDNHIDLIRLSNNVVRGATCLWNVIWFELMRFPGSASKTIRATDSWNAPQFEFLRMCHNLNHCVLLNSAMPEFSNMLESVDRLNFLYGWACWFAWTSYMVEPVLLSELPICLSIGDLAS